MPSKTGIKSIFIGRLIAIKNNPKIANTTVKFWQKSLTLSIKITDCRQLGQCFVCLCQRSLLW
ncbi:hypothetical protein H1P_550013 [Hyella patelloides LEGE 07179]|uniref:Uncharacterized protein n=1 Tax=Hyella patelloides LEGE 07179 TaxID=945734 RepID=A0A563W065_9CYAN|nr:hypothetical protein [Hyella patelloides]VEP17102.1 hypothetical protein H1P_550013 [Hyella patelloides LEGE 07179]